MTHARARQVLDDLISLTTIAKIGNAESSSWSTICTKRRKETERELDEANANLSAAERRWSAEMETMRMKMELDGLKQIAQFDEERKRHREER